MTPVSQTPAMSATASTPASVPKAKQLGASDFLRLMTEQLKQQDPFAPQDNAQMIAQMAQMSASSATAEMSVTLKDISAQLATQTALLQSLVANKTQTPGA